MTTSPVYYLAVGLLFGAMFLSLGIALGFWIARKAWASQNSNRSDFEKPIKAGVETLDDTEQIVNALRSFANWTNDFAGDFTRYQSKMNSLSKQALDGDAIKSKEEVQGLLGQIVDANQHLQKRLDLAEEKLEDQTRMLAGYLSEARTDALTGLANRRAFDQAIEGCFAKWNQNKESFTLALLDIDHFKSINDNYGHPAGDAVLREFARRLKEHVSGDAILIARYGGEEFALLLSLNLQDAAALVESTRLEIADSSFSAEDKTLAVTMSGGVSQIQPEDRIGKLVRRSDEALYSAKLGGRNRVFIHNGTSCESFGNPAVGLSSQPNLNGMVSPTNSSSSSPLEKKLLQQIDSLLEESSSKNK